MNENAFDPLPVTRGTVPPMAGPFFHGGPTAHFCPPPRPDLTAPSPVNLRYGLTLPSATATPDIAQESAEIMLETHAVEEAMVEPASVLVYELAAHACRFTGAGQAIHLAFRCDGDTFEVTVHDGHAAHVHRRLAAACDRRRESSLTEVRELVARHKGGWGYGTATPYAAGTCTWATLPSVREAA